MKAVKTREGSEGRRRHPCDTGGEACGQLVTLGSRRLRPYTCVLSTSSSVTALRRNLILRPASRLDAFSAYPIPTRIPGGAPGGTAGRPEVGRARSSRTSGYELLGGISLLSPEYLLSFERRPFHAEPPDHYALVSHLLGMSASQSSALMPLHSKAGYRSARGHLWKPPLRFWRRPPQSNCPPSGVPQIRG